MLKGNPDQIESKIGKLLEAEMFKFSKNKLWIFDVFRLENTGVVMHNNCKDMKKEAD